MKLRIQTDYALRTLMYLGYTGRSARAEDIADQFVISKDHLVKVIQLLAKLGYVRTTRGRGGGVSLAMPPDEIDVGAALELLEVGQRTAVAALSGCRNRAQPQFGVCRGARKWPHLRATSERRIGNRGSIRAGADTHRKARLPIRMIFENDVS